MRLALIATAVQWTMFAIMPFFCDTEGCRRPPPRPVWGFGRDRWRSFPWLQSGAAPEWQCQE